MGKRTPEEKAAYYSQPYLKRQLGKFTWKHIRRELDSWGHVGVPMITGSTTGLIDYVVSQNSTEALYAGVIGGVVGMALNELALIVDDVVSLLKEPKTKRLKGI